MSGTVWLSYQADLSFEAALISGIVPFIAGDILKIIIVLILAPKLQKRLKISSLFLLIQKATNLHLKHHRYRLLKKE